MELYSPRRFSWGTAFCAVAAIALVAAALLLGNAHVAIFALAPALLSIALFLGRQREFHGYLRDDCLEVENRPLKIPYDEIEGLTINGLAVGPDSSRAKRGTIMVTHSRGVVEIPPIPNLPVDKLYHALLCMLPTTGSRALSQAFVEHYQKEVAAFGVERVHAFARRRIVGCRPSNASRSDVRGVAAALRAGVVPYLRDGFPTQSRRRVCAVDGLGHLPFLCRRTRMAFLPSQPTAFGVGRLRPKELRVGHQSQRNRLAASRPPRPFALGGTA